MKDEVIKPGQLKAADLYTNAFNPYANGGVDKLAASK